MRTPAFLLASLVPSLAAAQDGPWSTLAVEAMGGTANFGHFLEQRVDGGERELRLDLTYAAAVAVSVEPVADTLVRVGTTLSSGSLAFEDDSGVGSDALDLDDLDTIFAAVIGVEALRYLLDREKRLVPYAAAGFTLAIWGLDDAEDGRRARVVQPGDSSTLVRAGASAALGLELRLTDALGVRGEWNNLGLGNPFDGKDAYRVVDGVTFSEPEGVRLGRVTLGLIWHVGG